MSFSSVSYNLDLARSRMSRIAEHRRMHNVHTDDPVTYVANTNEPRRDAIGGSEVRAFLQGEYQPQFYAPAGRSAINGNVTWGNGSWNAERLVRLSIEEAEEEDRERGEEQPCTMDINDNEISLVTAAAPVPFIGRERDLARLAQLYVDDLAPSPPRELAGMAVHEDMLDHAESAFASRFLNFVMTRADMNLWDYLGTEQEPEIEEPTSVSPDAIVLIERRRCRRTGRVTDLEVRASDLDTPRPYYQHAMVQCQNVLVRFWKTCVCMIDDAWGNVFHEDQLRVFRHTIQLRVHEEIEHLSIILYIHDIDAVRRRLLRDFCTDADNFMYEQGANMLVVDRSYWLQRLVEEVEKEFPDEWPWGIPHVD